MEYKISNYVSTNAQSPKAKNCCVSIIKLMFFLLPVLIFFIDYFGVGDRFLEILAVEISAFSPI